MAGFPVIAIDNVSAGLGGDLLCQMIERPIIRVRLLGKSDIMEIESRATVYANGNNLVIEGDMTRRTLLSKLDAQIERPEERAFKFDPVARVLASRGAYIAAALTIVRAYMHAGRPDKLPVLQSFAEWSDNVRSALVWLGKADPTVSIEEVRKSDPVLNSLGAALVAWQAVFMEPKTTHQVSADLASFDAQDENRMTLREALLPVAGVRGAIDAQKLGYWLRKSKGRPVGQLRFEIVGTVKNTAVWNVV